MVFVRILEKLPCHNDIALYHVTFIWYSHNSTPWLIYCAVFWLSFSITSIFRLFMTGKATGLWLVDLTVAHWQLMDTMSNSSIWRENTNLSGNGFIFLYILLFISFVLLRLLLLYNFSHKFKCNTFAMKWWQSSPAHSARKKHKLMA